MSSISSSVPVLPLRDIVVFPNVTTPLFVGREKSISALDFAMNNEKKILLIAQKNADIDDPKEQDLYSIGTIAEVLQLLKLPDGTVKILVEGKSISKVIEYNNNNNFLDAKIQNCKLIEESNNTLLSQALVNKFNKLSKSSKKFSEDTNINFKNITNPDIIANKAVSTLGIELDEKQKILETLDVQKKLEIIIGHLDNELELMTVEKRIRGRVKNQMEKTQREYYLNEQLKAIQKELGDIEDGKDEIKEIEKSIKKAKMPKEAEEKCFSELKKLKTMSPMSAESTVVRNYLDWMISLPWNNASVISTDLEKAQNILDKDHYGLEKVKDRILEFLAVQSRLKKIKGPILCLVGPPGVGKTSLGKSIAKATGREFVRMSLGGVRDEAEIRGHRRTYIGSLPGKIIQMMKKAGKTNPLFLLDEIDKVGMDYRGDPSSALLEALDPEQNKDFNDHYLEVDYDLSNVMFITTANTLNIPGPLLDRMEVIRLSGYTEEEKLQIAKKYLLPKQLKDNGLRDSEINLQDKELLEIIRNYTRESGVRGLEREISKLLRKSLKEIIIKKNKSINLDEKNIENYLGVRKFKHGAVEQTDQIGVVTGLAWTEVGGELLSIETVIMPGKGKMEYTGKLGDVMKESIKAAKSYIKSKSLDYGILPSLFDAKDLHVHVPEGATPKDGPSAGIGMVTSIVSALSGIAVKKDVAMTGEVTLRGRVLPIGGLKEKLLAALRGGIKTVIIPDDNKKDLKDIPENVKVGMRIVPVQSVDEVLEIALIKKLLPISSNEYAAMQKEKVSKDISKEIQH